MLGIGNKMEYLKIVYLNFTWKQKKLNRKITLQFNFQVFSSFVLVCTLGKKVEEKECKWGCWRANIKCQVSIKWIYGGKKMINN